MVSSHTLTRTVMETMNTTRANKALNIGLNINRGKYLYTSPFRNLSSWISTQGFFL